MPILASQPKPKWIALVLAWLVLIGLWAAMYGCVVLPTLRHPRSSYPLPEQAEGPDTTQKFDDSGHPNFGPSRQDTPKQFDLAPL